jgi:hypothetical protein
MVEKHHSSCEDGLGRLGGHRVLTELDQGRAGLSVHNEVKACLSLIDVTKHLQRDQVVVVDHLIVWVFDVHAHQVLEDADIDSLPMLVKDVGCRGFVLEE